MRGKVIRKNMCNMKNQKFKICELGKIQITKMKNIAFAD